MSPAIIGVENRAGESPPLNESSSIGLLKDDYCWHDRKWGSVKRDRVYAGPQDAIINAGY